MARVPLTGGRVGTITFSRMPQVRHMKEIFRGGLNQTSGSYPAGAKVKFVRKPRARR